MSVNLISYQPRLNLISNPINRFRQKFFIYVLIAFALTPMTEFAAFALGFCLDNSFVYSFLQLGLIVFILFIPITKGELYFFFALLSPILFNSLFYLINEGFLHGFIEVLKSIKNYYFLFIVGFVVYKLFYKFGEINSFYICIVYTGVFIAFFNLIYAIDRYFNLFGLSDFVHACYPSYIPYLNSYIGMLRPVGYFYDIHSQAYTPLASLILIALLKLPLKFKPFVVFILLSSILVSSVRMSYVTLIIFGLIVIFSRRRSLNFYLFMLGGLFFIFWFFHTYIIMIFEQIVGLQGESANIIRSHLMEIPFLLWLADPMTLLFGGNSSFRGEIYSEVYLWTLLFYIGVFGLLFYFLPFISMFDFKKNYLGLVFAAYFIFSLLHYKVYNTGVNIFASSIGFIYMFDIINRTRLGVVLAKR